VPAEEGQHLKTGDNVRMRIEPSRLHLFDAATGRRVEIDAAGARQLDASPQGDGGLAS
jgi:hypothetical protein